MPDDLLRHFFGGFVRMHILYHAAKEPVWGVEIIEELAPGATAGLSSSVNGSKDEPRRNAVARRSHVTGNPLHDRHCWTSQQWHPRATWGQKGRRSNSPPGETRRKNPHKYVGELRISLFGLNRRKSLCRQEMKTASDRWRMLAERGAARIRTGDGGFAIHCLSRLATAPCRS